LVMANKQAMAKLQSIIADRVKTLRKAAGLTQEQLSESAGVGPEFLSRLETARRVPSLGTLVDLAAALNVDPVDLIGRLGDDARAQRAERLTTAFSRLTDKDAAFLESELTNWMAHLKRR